MGDERGSGLLGAVFGLGVFLALLLFAVQLLLNLYATSMVTAVAFDAARLVAVTEAGVDETAARAHVGALLGRYEEEGGELAIDITTTPDAVELHVDATHPVNLLPNISFPYQRVERTITVRVEEFR